MAKLKIPAVTLGLVQGLVEVPATAKQPAAVMSAQFYAGQEAEDFANELVGIFNVPAWLPKFADWFPAEEVKALGFGLGKNKPYALATAGVDPHTDSAEGLVLIWVVHNDGLAFKQGRVTHKTKPGEWFIFDDRKSHEVKSSKGPGTYLAIAVPLKELPAAKA